MDQDENYGAMMDGSILEDQLGRRAHFTR